MLGVFAEFETNLRKERQAEGIAKAKAAGVYKGRPPSNRCQQGAGVEEKRPRRVEDALKIGQASVYRALTSAP
jgi:DNA invertase Pin-like site-specific DNA recombinase